MAIEPNSWAARTRAGDSREERRSPGRLAGRRAGARRSGRSIGARLALSLLLSAAAAQTAHAAPVSGDDLCAALKASISERLGVEANLDKLADWPPLDFAAEQTEISVRYPAHKVSSLPEALELRVNGRIEACLPLARFVQFSLPVAVAPKGLALRSLVSPEQLALETRTLRAGSECCCDLARLSGLETRAAVPAGALVLPSRLRAPADVKRGDSVTIVMLLSGVEVRAEASALADAYIGQRISVQRRSDRKQFSGLLCAGALVEVE